MVSCTSARQECGPQHFKCFENGGPRQLVPQELLKHFSVSNMMIGTWIKILSHCKKPVHFCERFVLEDLKMAYSRNCDDPLDTLTYINEFLFWSLIFVDPSMVSFVGVQPWFSNFQWLDPWKKARFLYACLTSCDHGTWLQLLKIREQVQGKKIAAAGLYRLWTWRTCLCFAKNHS